MAFEIPPGPAWAPLRLLNENRDSISYTGYGAWVLFSDAPAITQIRDFLFAAAGREILRGVCWFLDPQPRIAGTQMNPINAYQCFIASLAVSGLLGMTAILSMQAFLGKMAYITPTGTGIITALIICKEAGGPRNMYRLYRDVMWD